jgi:glucose-6-phosphate isomerase
VLKDKDISINVISKSGTTIEPAIAFKVFKEFMEKKYGKDKARKRIYITTDREKGLLREMALDEKYTSFVIPDDIGGRYSVLTAVGLLSIAAAGIDITELMHGAYDAMESYDKSELSGNGCYLYAAVRNALYRKKHIIEILVNYEPSIHYFTEWWKQLFGESEGKDRKGIFPAGLDYTTDLHSMGQYIQDGPGNMFETVVNIIEPRVDCVIKQTAEDADRLNFISGKTLDYINKKAMEGTQIAHIDGGIPNLVISIQKLVPYYLGGLIYFFEKACGISGYLLGVNPFNQPGVQVYKKNMYTLLGKHDF